MKRVICLAAHYPEKVLIVLALITLVALFQLPHLQLRIAAEGMMVNDRSAISDYKNSLKTFGSEAITVIYLEDKNLLDPDKLLSIQKAIRAVESIPQVTHTTSLFSMRHLRTVDGYTHTSPYLKKIPTTRQAAKQIVEVALQNPLIQKNLLSNDGTAMAINVFLDMASYHNGFDQAVTDALDKAIAPLQSELEHAFQLGDPSIRHHISHQINDDLKFTLPLSLFVLSLTLWLVLKRSIVTLIPLLTAVLSVIWILGIMAALNIPLNVMTAIIPALLVIIGSTEDIHLISEYQAGVVRGLSGYTATEFMAKHMGTAVLLTYFTTCLGFLSISMNHIDLLQQFGLMTAVGLTLNFLITVTLVPACLQLIGRQSRDILPLSEPLFSTPLVSLFKAIRRSPRLSFMSIAVVIAISGYWASHIEIDNNAMRYLPSSSAISNQAKRIHDHLAGTQTLAILIKGSDEAFLKSRNLQHLQAIQQQIEGIENIDKSFSFADFIGVIHSGIDAEHQTSAYLPESDEVISEYSSLLSHASYKSFVSEDFNQARILVRHSISSSQQLNLVVDRINQICKQQLPMALTAKITGSSYLNSLAVDYMADGQTRSLLMMLTIIFLIIATLLSSLKIGFIAVIANLFPIVVLFGVMGYFGIALDTGTVMVAAIALGICVDHSMHFMLRYRCLMESGRPPHAALIQTIKQESRPILTTAISLTMGFATLIFSQFPPVSMFGLLSSMVMLLALVGTFVITPYLLHVVNLITRTTDIKLLRKLACSAKDFSQKRCGPA